MLDESLAQHGELSPQEPGLFVRAVQRLRPLLVGLLVAICVWGMARSSPGAGEDSNETLADMLARDHGLILELGSVRSAGRAEAVALMRVAGPQSVHFVARQGEQKQTDIYRADLRVARDGRVVDLDSVYNISRTPFASEEWVAGRGSYGLYTVKVFEQLQSLLLVDNRGDERRFDDSLDGLQRRLAGLTNLQRTGRWEGIGLRLYAFTRTPRSVSASFTGGGEATSARIEPHFEEERAKATKQDEGDVIVLDLQGGEVVTGVDMLEYRGRAWTHILASHWLVNTIRDFSFIGPRPIALLEKWAFTAADYAERIGIMTGLVAGDDLNRELASSTPDDVDNVTAVASEERGDWPPPPIPPLLTPPLKGEGQWTPFVAEWQRRLPGAPAAVYKTALRFDRERDSSVVVLAALDLRQLDVALVAGTVTPASMTGSQGTGRMPRDPDLLRRVVAAFNGGFQTAHGAYGMMVDGNVQLPPYAHSATLAVLRDSTVAMGTWNNSMQVPEDIQSFRQNLPPLVADGVWNPTKKRYWGGTVSDLDQVNTARSAVAWRPPGILLYAWGRSVSAKALGKVLNAAGVDYGMHLDMNPYHTGFHLLEMDPEQLTRRGRLRDFRAKALSDQMAFDEKRFVNRNSKDFFYLTLRRLFHEGLPEPPLGFESWQAHQTQGLEDGFLPRAAISRGAGTGDLLVALEVGAMNAKLRPGTGEPTVLDGLGRSKPVAGITLRRPVAMLDLGTVDRADPKGLIVNGRIFWPPVPGLPAVAIDKKGSLRVNTRGEHKGERSLRQLSPLLIQGEPPNRAVVARSSLERERRHALGIDDFGRAFYLSRERGDMDDYVRAFRHLGVQTAVWLPRSEQSRIQLLSVREGQLMALEPLMGEELPMNTTGASTTRLFLTAHPSADRAQRLQMEDAVLSRQEARRQKALRAKINEMREALREVANKRYRAYIEKVKARREERTGLKSWDAQ